jgi:D-arabinose 1-dehydrogenase-like Zn-dependent alcohol dehydrogenase
MPGHLTRRSFLKAAAGAAGLVILAEARSATSARANDRLNVALVGVGGRGRWFVDTIPKMENVVALCDIHDGKVAGALKRWEDLAARFETSQHDWERRAAREYKRLLGAKPRTFADFRKMLDAMGGGLDAVVCATPDHTHAVISAAAIKAGKHVFCEKPLTRTLHESRALRQLARTHKVATSMGNQGTAAAGSAGPLNSSATAPSAGSKKSISGIPAAGPTGRNRPKARRPSPTGSTGTSGSARPPSAPTIPTG